MTMVKISVDSNTYRSKGITNGISAIFDILVGMYLYKSFNYTVGVVFSFILAVRLALIG